MTITQLHDVSRRRWLVRGVAIAALLVLGIVQFRSGLAAAVVRKDVALAQRLDGSNARVLAEASEAALTRAARDRGAVDRATELARRAIARDPTQVVAIRTLGLAATIGGDPARARRLFGFSQHLSRRDRATQLWLIEDAVAREDVPGALRHFDIAMRVSPASNSVLFPVLVGALTDPALVAPIGRMIATGGPWSDLFLQHVVGAVPEPRDAAALFRAMATFKAFPRSELVDRLIDRLVERNQFEEAWGLYATGHPTAARGGIRNPGFSESPIDPTAFDWSAVNEGARWADIAVSGDQSELRFEVGATGTGVVARQLLLLAAGRHRLEARYSPGDAMPPIKWRLTCAVTRQSLPVELATPRGDRAAAATLTVPSGCPAQLLEIEVEAEGTGAIDHVQIAG